MEQANVPAGYQTVMPYIIVKGAAGFKVFMEQVFDAAEIMVHMRDEHTIMHGEVRIGDSPIMFADSTEEIGTRPAGMFVYVADADKTYQKAMDAGATSRMAPSDQPYGRSGGVDDPYGNTWWITSV